MYSSCVFPLILRGTLHVNVQPGLNLPRAEFNSQNSLRGYMLKRVEISPLPIFKSCRNDRVEISTRVEFGMFLPSEAGSDGVL